MLGKTIVRQSINFEEKFGHLFPHAPHTQNQSIDTIFCEDMFEKGKNDELSKFKTKHSAKKSKISIKKKHKQSTTQDLKKKNRRTIAKMKLLANTPDILSSKIKVNSRIGNENKKSSVSISAGARGVFDSAIGTDNLAYSFQSAGDSFLPTVKESDASGSQCSVLFNIKRKSHIKKFQERSAINSFKENLDSMQRLVNISYEQSLKNNTTQENGLLPVIMDSVDSFKRNLSDLKEKCEIKFEIYELFQSIMSTLSMMLSKLQGSIHTKSLVFSSHEKSFKEEIMEKDRIIESLKKKDTGDTIRSCINTTKVIDTRINDFIQMQSLMTREEYEGMSYSKADQDLEDMFEFFQFIGGTHVDIQTFREKFENFDKFQSVIRSQGKNLQVITSKMMAKSMTNEGPQLTTVQTQTRRIDDNDQLQEYEDRIKELEFHLKNQDALINRVMERSKMLEEENKKLKDSNLQERIHSSEVENCFEKGDKKRLKLRSEVKFLEDLAKKQSALIQAKDKILIKHDLLDKVEMPDLSGEHEEKLKEIILQNEKNDRLDHLEEDAVKEIENDISNKSHQRLKGLSYDFAKSKLFKNPFKPVCKDRVVQTDEGLLPIETSISCQRCASIVNSGESDTKQLMGSENMQYDMKNKRDFNSNIDIKDERSQHLSDISSNQNLRDEMHSPLTNISKNSKDTHFPLNQPKNLKSKPKTLSDPSKLKNPTHKSKSQIKSKFFKPSSRPHPKSTLHLSAHSSPSKPHKTSHKATSKTTSNNNDFTSSSKYDKELLKRYEHLFHKSGDQCATPSAKISRAQSSDFKDLPESNLIPTNTLKSQNSFTKLVPKLEPHVPLLRRRIIVNRNSSSKRSQRTLKKNSDLNFTQKMSTFNKAVGKAESQRAQLEPKRPTSKNVRKSRKSSKASQRHDESKYVSFLGGACNFSVQ
ncbi:unnamed protein product [Moneuplotes crassus]|uniref:Uncharacterized protein n=1 Tax=Euplotes crassus TaxID=5936 RepID=A0AAD1XVZ9_EUPCR|nr:unnamed protein product [Moneuplotes crassus]